MDRVYNFSKGPAMLPKEVLKRASEELMNYKDTGMSVMELPTGSRELAELLEETESQLRETLEIPDNYRILFLQGGSKTQFAAVPVNLLSDRKCADYILSGPQSRDAYLEAKKFGDIAIVASSGGSDSVYATVPETDRSDFRPDSDYVYMCYSNVYHGTKFNYIPDTGSIPLVADMSGSFLSEPIDVSKFGLIFASAQANFGIAGLTVVIIRDDLVGRVSDKTPSMLNYKLLADSKSMFNTPPVFSIYMTKLVLEWIKNSVGGIHEMKRRNERKASLLYEYLDRSHYYTAPVDKNCRSMTSVRFYIGDNAFDEKFLREAAEEGLVNLDANSNIGGMCAALYNSMPYEGVEKLIAFMDDFMQNNPRFDTF